jgi:uncharacterized protein
MPHPSGSRAALLAFIASDPALRALLGEARARDAAPGAPDPAHDVEHLLRVARNTLRCDPALEPGLAIAAALLHDAVRLPKNHPERSRAGERAAEHARARLVALGFGDDEVEEAAAAIRDHGFSRGAEPESALGRALQDGDRLDALGGHGLYRVIATGVAMGADLYDPDDPWAARRALDDARHSVDHFFAKLLRLPATMRTPAGRAEAERRVALLCEFLRALGEEIGLPPPEETPPGPPRGEGGAG